LEVKSVAKTIVQLGRELVKREWKLATVESCTGGGLAYQLTSVPGSSEWFERGFVTYSNLAKTQMVGVRLLTLSSFGAVSEETAAEMAEGARHFSDAQMSVSITGIAGPGGGTKEKPVGTVCFAWAGQQFETVVITKHFKGSRNRIRKLSIEFALEGLYKRLGVR
jgi:nicotinamide-nucleotide amidase